MVFSKCVFLGFFFLIFIFCHLLRFWNIITSVMTLMQMTDNCISQRSCMTTVPYTHWTSVLKESMSRCAMIFLQLSKVKTERIVFDYIIIVSKRRKVKSQCLSFYLILSWFYDIMIYKSSQKSWNNCGCKLK